VVKMKDSEQIGPGYSMPERRKHTRVPRSLVVSYAVSGEAEEKRDITQVKNISQGGMLFTTNRMFLPKTLLSIKVRFPSKSDWAEITGEVIESKEVIRDLVYGTRVHFVTISPEDKQTIGKLVEQFKQERGA
jgi:hypothetical protein